MAPQRKNPISEIRYPFRFLMSAKRCFSVVPIFSFGAAQRGCIVTGVGGGWKKKGHRQTGRRTIGRRDRLGGTLGWEKNVFGCQNQTTNESNSGWRFADSHETGLPFSLPSLCSSLGEHGEEWYSRGGPLAIRDAPVSCRTRAVYFLYLTLFI